MYFCSLRIRNPWLLLKSSGFSRAHPRPSLTVYILRYASTFVLCFFSLNRYRQRLIFGTILTNRNSDDSYMRLCSLFIVRCCMPTDRM